MARWEPGSILAYDFKVIGMRARFLRLLQRESSFRLRKDPGMLTRFHEGLGFAVDEIVGGEVLQKRILTYKPTRYFKSDTLAVLKTKA